MPEGFTRRSPYERELQPVAIISVDPVSRTAIGVTRTRHSININCAYATGDTITIPASGEQWYCERFDMEWRLYGRIPFNDPTLNIKPEEGQVSVGSASGPLELNGTEVRANSFLRLGTAYFRDSGIALERSTDKINWEPIVTAAAGLGGLVPLIAKALTGFDGDDQTLALLSLENWAEILNTIIENFSAFWNEICQNVFVNGLKRMGFGETDLAKIVDGFQNFIDYLFSVIFCDFDGNLTPQTVLARIRDLLAPIINNPFVQGLQAIAEVLGVAVGNLLNDAVNGITTFLRLAVSIVLCRFADVQAILGNAFPDNPETGWLQGLSGIFALFDEDGPFTPAALFKVLYDFFSFLGLPEIDGIPNPVGIFFTGLASFFLALTGQETSGSVLQDAIQGGVGFVQLIFRIISCDTGVLDDLAALVGDMLPGTEDPLGILAVISGLITAVLENPLVLMVQNFLTTLFPDLMDGTLIQQLLDGASNLVHLLIKVVTSILPFRELWETLLPFVDWTKVDEMEFVLPDLTEFFLNGITDLWKMIFKPLDDLIKLIVPAAGETPFTDFIENIANFFAPVGAFFADPLAFLDDINLGLDGTIIPALLENVFKIVIVDPLTGALQFVESLVPAVGDFLANLLALFGVDFNVNAEDFDLATALPAVATAIAQGIFGQAAATVKTIFDRLVGLFGGSSVFTGGTFDISALATYFVNNVLNLATSALQALVEGTGSLVYQIAQAIITGIRGIPFVGAGIANFLQGVVDTLVNFSRGTVKSGSNILADPGAEIASMWTDPTTGLPVQADATRVTTAALKRSAGASLRVTSGGSTAKQFWFNVDNTGAVASIDTDTGEVNYAECYVLYPITVSGATNAGTSGTVTLVARYYDSTGAVSTTPELTATASMNKNNTTWVKLSGNFTTPTTGVANTQYDRVDFGFRLVGGQTTSDARFYVDDMLVREISEAAATNQNLYGNASRPSSSTQLREPVVPSGISSTKILGTSGTGNIGTEVGGLNTAVGSTSNGTGLSGTVYGTNGQGGLVGFGGTTTTVTNTYNNVFSSTGLIPRLYGPSATAPASKIVSTALPDSLGAVGSGIIMFQVNTISSADWGPSGGYGPNTAGFKYLNDGFYPNISASATDDLVYDNTGGRVGLRALRAGWYMIEVGFGLRSSVQYTYWWSFTPAIYESRTARVKYGSSVVSARDTNFAASFTLTPFNAQSSFIVYMNASDVIRPGYLAIQENNAGTGSAEILQSRNANFEGTYFSAALLNRSLL